MKAIEDTWVDGGDGRVWQERAPGDQNDFPVADCCFDDITEEYSKENARLIAKAPEMARMLLAREWDESDRDGELLCSDCRAYRYTETGEHPHRDGCAWLALMKAIGAR